MKAVFVGAGPLTVMTARSLLKRGHEVIIVEWEKERIEVLNEQLDCGFLHGDGSKPAVLRETDPEKTDVLYCLTNEDQTNIISSLVGRSLGFPRVVTKIDDPEFEHICIELGLEDTIIPSRTIGGHLADMFEGRDPLELSTMFRYEARAFSFVAREEDEGAVADLRVPKSTRVICIYRQNQFIVPTESSTIKAGDEVVLITQRENLETLQKQWTHAIGKQPAG